MSRWWSPFRGFKKTKGKLTRAKRGLKRSLKKMDRKLAPYDEEILYGVIYPAAGAGAAGLGLLSRKPPKETKKKLEK